MQSWLVLLISALYLSVLFFIAWWGDRRSRHKPFFPPDSRRAAVAYALTLAVYNTSWSFYGSVGRATTQGYEFLPIYIGPVLGLVLAQPIFAKVVLVAKAQNATSISDFISARYGKSQSVAALVTLTTLIGVLPYLALQLKAVGASFDVLTSAPSLGSHADTPIWEDKAFAVAIIMAAFTIIFGVRHIHSSEHHRGLMLAVAFESLVKLAAFLVVSSFIVFGMFDGFGDLFERAHHIPALDPLLTANFAHPIWFSEALIAFIVFLCLPQAFHVTAVENENPRHTRSAAWLYPAYLFILSLFMVPIAIAGYVTFGTSVNPDTYVINLPIAAKAYGIGLFAFIGGMSAATGMVIVAVVSLSTMLCNDVVMPLLLRTLQVAQTGGGDMSRLLLRVRRLSVLAILMLAYITYRLVDKGYSLTLIGLLSFVAVAQFGPAFFGGLYWRRANRAAAISSISAGFCVWVYTLLLPAIAKLSPVPSELIEDGLFGIGWLKPQALFGMSGLDPISHATFWSLSLNLAIFVAVSFLRQQSTVERIQAVAFVEGVPGTSGPHRSRSAFASIADLRILAARFVGLEHGTLAFDNYISTRHLSQSREDPVHGMADLDMVRFTENLVAGSIGAASARVVMAASLQGSRLSRSAAMAMLDEASEALYFNRKLLQTTLESVVQGICVVDADFKIAAWNRRFIDLLDFPGELVHVGLPFSDLVSFNKARGEYGADDLKAIITNRNMKAQAFPYVYERQRPDGTVIEVAYDRMPGGGYVSTYTDVTERYRTAMALRNVNESLEQRVRERTEDLLRTKAEAEHANASKTRFLAAASHDLLQPLNAARLFVSALEESLRTETSSEMPPRRVREKNLAHNAAAALRSTEQLIDGLLDISSLDTGIIKPEIEIFEIEPLLSRLEIEFSVLASEKGLILKHVPSSCVIKSDPQLLRRILQNFISNAVRYTQTGRILMGCRHVSGKLRIEIWDTGIGIAPDKLTDIFEEFCRLETNDLRAGIADNNRGLSDKGLDDKGLGLGLAIVERMSAILDAPVSVRSWPGKGTCFAINVPLSAQRPKILTRSAPIIAKTTMSGLNVLCVDNEPAILAGLSALLAEWGHRAIGANSISAAMARFESEPQDVILVDYHLGADETGLDLLRGLKARGVSVPALLMTADRSKAIRVAAQELGCECLYKPVKPASLRRYLSGQSFVRGE